MQERHLYEYAVIRVVPRVEREEFINVGVVLYCASKKSVQVKYRLDEQRLKALAPEIDILEIAAYLQSFERICNGSKDGGPISSLGVAERFRWLTATRSTMVQTSRVHPGLCTDHADKLEHLYRQMVE